MRWIRLLVPRFRVLDAEMRRREEFYAWSKADRDAYRLEQLNARWSEAMAGSAYYTALAAEEGLPPQFESLEQFCKVMSITQKAQVQANPQAFRLPGCRCGEWMMTGGSTGVPLSVFWGLKGHLHSLRDQYWARTWWGVNVFDRQAMLWGHSHSFGRGLRGAYRKIMVPLIDYLRNRRRFSAYRLNRETLRTYYDAIVKFRPFSLYAYASAAHLLALANMDRGPIPHPLKAAFLAAEPLLPPFRKSIAQVFGCPSVGEYGSIECGMLAYEHPEHRQYQVFEQSVLLETLPAEGGYNILVTQLRPTGFPLFRYEIGDMTSNPLAAGPSGIDMLRDVIGRTHDVIRSPTGQVCYAEFLTHLVEQVPHVAVFSATQRLDYSLDLYLQTDTLKPQHTHWITQEIQRVLGDISVRIHPVERLERTQAGKLRWVVSELTQGNQRSASKSL